MRDMIGLYIHIPFCRKRCIYCDFAVIDMNNKIVTNLFDVYVKFIVEELRLYEGFLSRVRTVYLGGGTPSLLGRYYLDLLIRKLSQFVDLNSIVEFTIEVNPEDVDGEFVEFLKSSPINRISLGIQSMDDRLLRLLSRRNTSYTNTVALELLRKYFDNVSCDVIYGIPSSTSEDTVRTLEKILDFEVKHVSAYSLTVEEYTALSYFVKKGIVSLREDAEDFFKIHDLLSSKGFEHYEISNYAVKGFESRHNMIYWDRCEYVGIGLGASGFLENRRYKNTLSIKEYISRLSKGLLPVDEVDEIDNYKAYQELVMLGFRKKDGFDIYNVKKFLDEDGFNKFLNRVREIESLGYLKLFEGKIIPTLQGWIVSNYIVRELTSL
ncbi:MAG: radical SAM family heme chaperone HemW [Brevinematales bacterium]|nr:radical SAM family heme chaperone HemW [Brevinematales bacterium]